jgi:hypothetical protein
MMLVRLLNQPTIKEGIKNVAATMTFSFGLIEVFDLCQILRGKEISTEKNSTLPKWMQIANTASLVFAKASLLLSGATSRPGVFIISKITSPLLSTDQLARLGPNTVFAVNPWHPRHFFSIAAVVLALPASAHSLYEGARWAFTQQHNEKSTSWLSNAKIRLMALLNTVTSRPVQHLGNQLCRKVLARL